MSFATTATAGSPVGTYLVTPQGVWSPNYFITFVAGTLTVVPGATAITLVASPNPSGFNQPVTLTATVSVMAGAGVPTGSVQFVEGGICSAPCRSPAGTAALTTNGFSAGSHTITVTYSGDPNFAGSIAGQLFHREAGVRLVDDHRHVIVESLDRRSTGHADGDHLRTGHRDRQRGVLRRRGAAWHHARVVE